MLARVATLLLEETKKCGKGTEEERNGEEEEEKERDRKRVKSEG